MTQNDCKQITKAILLVGGKGSRLYPLTLTRPKPLVPFCNIPIIEYQIEKLAKENVNTIILALNYFSEQIIQASRLWEKKYKLKIIYSLEKEPLGTAGPLKLAEKHLNNEDFIVMNTDIYCKFDLNNMIENFYKNNPIAQLMTTKVKDPTRFGVMQTKGELVMKFLEKPKRKEDIISNIINGGVYILSSEILKYIELRNMSIETEVFPKIAEEGKMTHYLIESLWFDIGVPTEYLNGQKAVLLDYEISISNDILKNNIRYDTIENDILKNNIRYDSLENDIIYNYKNNISIGKNVKIGSNCELSNCAIFDNTVVEDNCIIKNCIIGFNCRIRKNSRIHEISNGGCSVIGDFVVVEPNSAVSDVLLKLEAEENVVDCVNKLKADKTVADYASKC